MAAGLSHGAISRIVNGERPGLETCKALARYFGVPPEFVLRLAGHVSAAATSNSPRQDYLAKLLSTLTPARRDLIVENAIALAEFEAVANEQNTGFLRQSADHEQSGT